MKLNKSKSMKRAPLRNLIFIILVSLTLNVTGQKLIRENAVDDLVTLYPEAQLCDLYKSFYQDFFGPGHLMADSQAARNYFDYELTDKSEWGGPLWEYTGQGKNFVRLNMLLVKKGIIPKDEYFKAFLNSLGRTDKPADEIWMSEWQEIDSIVNNNGYKFKNEEKDRKLILEKMNNRNFTIHHSQRYDSIYNFHYRIISLPEFEKLKSKFNF